MDRRCRDRVCHHQVILNHISLVLPDNVNDENLDGDTQLKLAIKHTHIGALRNLMLSPSLNINHQCRNGLSALHITSLQSDPFRSISVQLMSTRGIDPDLQTQSGTTALYMAVTNHYANRNDDTGYINTLLSYGANPNIPEKQNGFTPLIYACLSNLSNISLALLYGRADPNILDNQGYSALYYACTHGYIDIVHCLLGFGADPNFIERSSGHTILSKTILPEILQVLIQFGANPYIADALNNPLIRLTYQMHIRKAKRILRETMTSLVKGPLHEMMTSELYEPQVWDLILTHLFGDIALV